MKRNLLAALISLAFPQHYIVDDKGGGGGGGGEGTPPAVKPEDARTSLTEFGHSAEALKGMPDADVIKLHGQATGATKKAIEAAQTAWKAEQAKGAPTGDVKLELPKDGGLTQEDVNAIAAIAKEKKLSQEAATLLLEREKSAAIRTTQRQAAEHTARVEGWEAAVKNDKELGGDNLATTQRVAQLFIDKFMPNSKDDAGKEVVHPLRKMLRETGFGNHPEVVRLFTAVGKLMDEGKGPGAGGAPGAGGKKSAEDVLYGSPTT